MLNPGSPHTRVLLGDDFQVITRGTDEGFGDEIFVDGFGESPTSTNLLSSIPTALTRWGEESQILDPESVHWCVTSLKPSIFPVLEKNQAAEIAKEKEEAAKKKKETEEKNAASKANEGKKTDETKNGEKKGEKNEEEKSQPEASTMQAEQEVPGAEAPVPVSAPGPSSSVEEVAEATAPPATVETPELSADESSASILIALHMEEPTQRALEGRTSTPVDSDIMPAAAAVADRIASVATAEAVESQPLVSDEDITTPVPPTVLSAPQPELEDASNVPESSASTQAAATSLREQQGTVEG